ncbi:MAG: hypothetical protein ACAI25_04140, partial [Planctomycetota bacterium]
RVHRTTRYLIPRDVELELRDSHDGCVHLGELPAEIHDKRGVRHTTEPLLLTGLGSDAPAILGALDAARTDETYPPATVESTPHAPSHVKDLCASRAPVPLPAFVAATPPEVPPAVARAVRGCVARECGVPVDFVGPGDSVRGFMRKRDYVDFTSFLLAVGSALGQEFRATGGSTAVQSPDGTLDEETWLDLTVVELAAAITRGRRPPGARPGR